MPRATPAEDKHKVTPRALHAPARLAGVPLLRTQTDERLVDLVRVGNDGAFEAIVARYRRPLLRYCSSLLPEGRAEDAVQQAFLRAYDALRASEGEMNLRPWLYRIAHNQSLNILRDRSLAHDELSEGIDGVERPDQAFEKNERLRDTLAAVTALPERQRNAIILRELEGRGYEEIATQLGVTGGAVRQLLSRARTTLRAGMTAVTPYPLIARPPWAAAGSDRIAERISELCGAGAGGAALAKACATALVTGAVMGGVGASPDGGPADGRAGGDPSNVITQGLPGGARASGTGAGDTEPVGATDRGRGREAGRGDDRSAEDPDGDDNGPGASGGETDDAPEPDERKPGEDHSGPGGGDSDSSGTGSGSEPDEPETDSSGSGSNSASEDPLADGPEPVESRLVTDDSPPSPLDE